MDDLLAAFEREREDYSAFAKLVAGFLDAKIAELQGVKARLPLVHSIKWRTKTQDSLRKKLQKLANADKSPADLQAVDDLAGVRVIFYFKDDMEAFAKNDFRAMFGQRTRESVDEKRRALDSFGYQSFHFTVSYASNSEFAESLREEDQGRFKFLKCEVQVRTILQHAWAETAHDIFYKRASDSSHTVEEEQAQRLFNAMAATLELLDDRLIKQKKIPKSNPPTQTILTDPPQIEDWVQIDPRQFKHNNVGYPYLLLHEGDFSELNHVENWQLYNSSTEFAVPNFKAEVWSHFRAKHRSFVDSLYSSDSTAVRVKSWDPVSKTLALQPALYSDQVTTNHPYAHACKLSNGKTVRDYAFQDGRLVDLSRSPLANTIGVACVIRTSDDYWLLGKRRAGLSVFSERWSCPVSGIVEWRERGNWHPKTFKEWMTESIVLECDQEMGLQISLDSVRYLGMALEAQRIGKPQVFFLLDLSHSRPGNFSAANIEARYKIYRIDHEFSALAFLEPKQVQLIVGGEWRDIMKVTKGEAVSSEVLMNVALADRFLKRAGTTNAP